MSSGFGSNPFGTAAPPGGFGQTGFGNAVPQPPAQATFGNNQGFAPNPFGAPAPASGFGPGLGPPVPQPAPGFTQPPAPAFGQPSAPAFGQTHASGFGQSSTQTPAPAPVSGFGTGSNVASSGFSASFGNGVSDSGGAPFNSALMSNSNPFGASGEGSSSGFGSKHIGNGSEGDSSAALFANAGVGAGTPAPAFGANHRAADPFGQSSNAAHTGPFGRNTFSGGSNTFNVGMAEGNSSDNDDMNDGNTDAISIPFGSMNPRNNFGTGSAGNNSSPFGGLATINENDHGMTGSNQSKEEEERIKKKLEERKKLQAEIEKKKRKLLERKNLKKKNQESDEGESDAGGLNASAAPFVPRSSVSDSHRSESEAAGGEKDIPDIAARNAVRFAVPDSSARNKLLPSELRNKSAPTVSSTNTSEAAGDREDLENATSLVGTCQYMCPDDELLRRERESDIQLLETPQPGTLHPKGWTLRNTVVKRFRRSAADYKLDVPEWVRPPDVLERVCSYLEEWVMDRDRQGADPRFPQGQAPPPLDVYQFIWDRTRMIRKDFILQNYVGTDGNCDARAVRCHERIARWHAMCEHQLSHISDFTIAQSQQNIQELGQTMKTLNQYYDDSLNRSIVEVPDENGNETRKDARKYAHGCQSDSVKGNPPVDFDGTPLNNTEDSSLLAARLVGGRAAECASHGTSESEMRALYILLTMNNEGGMEVLKYAAKLFQDRPVVYHSWQVQLALSVFKAKNENNYSRFFSILKAPSTPYLFCCIMFKYVESMRKAAIKTMSRAFGAKKRDTGETAYDAYPLVRLVSLLCFENVEEAINACRHYNITVKKVLTPSSSDPTKSRPSLVISWRATDFVDPVHPEKGTLIPLHPQKMVKTIESKLKGATRLAVCRGQVSGNGSEQLLLASSPVKDSAAEAVRAKEVAEFDKKYKTQMLLKKQQEEQMRLIGEERKREEARKLRQVMELKAKEKKKADAEALQRVNAEKEKIEAERRKKEAEFEQNRLREERERAKAKQAAEEAERRREADELRLLQERETAERLVREAEVKRKIEEEKVKEEQKRRKEEDDRRLKAEREARERAAEEKRRQIERQQEEIRQRRLANDRRKEREMQEKILNARKILIWRMLKDRLLNKMEILQDERQTLFGLNGSNFETYAVISAQLREKGEAFQEQQIQLDPSIIIDDLAQSKPASIDIAGMAADRLDEGPDNSFFDSVSSRTKKLTCLLKLAVVLPDPKSLMERSMVYLVDKWIRGRLPLRDISSCIGTMDHQLQYEIKIVAKRTTISKPDIDCDGELIIVPPLSPLVNDGVCDSRSPRNKGACIPRVVLVLETNSDPDEMAKIQQLVNKRVCDSSDSASITCPLALSAPSFEAALYSSVEMVIQKMSDRSKIFRLERISVAEFATSAIAQVLQTSNLSENSYENVSDVARSALSTLVKATSDYCDSNKVEFSRWPPVEFLVDDAIPGYFSDGQPLPTKWYQSLTYDSMTAAVDEMTKLLEGSFRQVLSKILDAAPPVVKSTCRQMQRKQQYAESLITALRWWIHQPGRKLHHIILPSTASNLLMGSICNALSLDKEEHMYDAWQTASVSNTARSEENNLSTPNGISLPDNPSEQDNAISRFISASETPASVFTSTREEAMSPIRSTEKFKRMRFDSPSVSTVKRVRKSRDCSESSAYTKRLKALLHGDTTVDMSVGNTTLSSLLVGAPKLNVDS